ncbi:MAG: prepilin-type N-terminal cleavage/methylation domain-containing protein [Thermaerobacter sp.]|nr:prepilin-type N-terminal cleavage/methylation domain-containing protein [Thermaerobacter sp.]
MKLHHKSRQSGFTLIELLAVVAILGILAGIAVPRVLGAIQNARESADTANIAMLQSAVERWAMENNPAGTLAGWNDLTEGTENPTAFVGVITDAVLTDTFAFEDTSNPLIPAFLSAIPNVPSGLAGGTEYRLIFHLVSGARHTATVVRVAPTTP